VHHLKLHHFIARFTVLTLTQTQCTATSSRFWHLCLQLSLERHTMSPSMRYCMLLLLAVVAATLAPAYGRGLQQVTQRTSFRLAPSCPARFTTHQEFNPCTMISDLRAPQVVVRCSMHTPILCLLCQQRHISSLWMQMYPSSDFLLLCCFDHAGCHLQQQWLPKHDPQV
jgi:hypothetical protein